MGRWLRLVAGVAVFVAGVTCTPKVIQPPHPIDPMVICRAAFERTLIPAADGAIDFRWETPGCPDGNYTITARISDAHGNMNRTRLRVTVQNGVVTRVAAADLP